MHWYRITIYSVLSVVLGFVIVVLNGAPEVRCDIPKIDSETNLQ